MAELAVDKNMLVEWVRAHPRHESRICQEAFVMAMSNILRNRSSFAGDRDWTYFDARDLICFRTMSQLNNRLIDVAYGRAILDDDREAIEVLERAALPGEKRKWRESLRTCPKEEALRHLATLEMKPDAGELWLCRIMLARRWGDLADPSWLKQCPQQLPQVAAHVARVLITAKPESIPTVRDFLLENQHVLILADPEPTLALMVTQATTPPDKTLAGFEPYACEALANAAAQWFLERGQPLGTLALTEKIRPYSKHADRAHQLRGLAQLAAGRIDAAIAEQGQIFDQPIADGLLIAIAEKRPDAVDGARIVAIAGACDARQPELFYKAVVALLSRKQLNEARELCRAKKSSFANNPVLSEIIAKISP